MCDKKQWIEIPRTPNEAAELLLSDLSAGHQKVLSNLDNEEFDLFYEFVAKFILDDFELWSGNDALLHSCYESLPTGDTSAEPAKIILNRVREMLQETCGIGINT